jgi:hypothetical protein
LKLEKEMNINEKRGQWSYLKDHSDIYIFINLLSNTGIFAFVMITGADTEITIS